MSRRNGPAGGGAHRRAIATNEGRCRRRRCGSACERLIEQAITDGCRGIVSFGMAGGPQARLEARCLPDRPRGGARERPLSQPMRHGPRVCRQGCLAPRSSASPASTGRSSPKRRSRRCSRRRVPRPPTWKATSPRASPLQHGLPFAVLRVVADPQERDLPPAALAGMRADGTTDVGSGAALSRQGSRSDCAAHPRRCRRRPRAITRYSAATGDWGLASASSISASLRSTWREKTYSAGRWRSSGISGAIGPSVLTPLQRQAPRASTAA